MSEPKLLAVCVHEAAHAVVAHRLGHEVLQLSAEPQMYQGLPVAGLATVIRPLHLNVRAKSTDTKERIKADVSVALAGFIAQQRFDADSDALTCAASDLYGVRMFAEGLFVSWPDGVIPVLFESYVRAQRLVEETWYEIIRVADLLSVIRTMSGDKFRSILDVCDLERSGAVQFNPPPCAQEAQTE